MKRNQPCQCGSNLKYKNCCGKLKPEQPAGASLFDTEYASQDPVKEVLSADDYYQQGTIHQDQGNLDEAIRLYQEALREDPEHIESNINLGAVLRIKKRYREAAELFNKALLLNPHPQYRLIANFNLGVVLRELGIFKESVNCFKETMLINQSFPEGHFCMGLSHRDLGDYENAEQSFQKALQIKPVYPQAQTEYSILCWLTGDYDNCRLSRYKVTSSSQSLPAEDKKFVIPYSLFVEKLLDFREKNPGYYGKRDDWPRLYIVGDSHSMSLANASIEFKGGIRQVESRNIVGCKAWHLANGTPNKYKAVLGNYIEVIPRGSDVIFMLGEIDCRISEGILKNHKKTGSDLKQSIHSLVKYYIDHISEVSEQRNLSPIICTVPPPHVSNLVGDEADKELLCEIIRLFNLELEENIKRKQYPSIDVYNKIPKNKGAADGSCHIDDYHLKPDVLASIISSCL